MNRQKIAIKNIIDFNALVTLIKIKKNYVNDKMINYHEDEIIIYVLEIRTKLKYIKS